MNESKPSRREPRSIVAYLVLLGVGVGIGLMLPFDQWRQFVAGTSQESHGDDDHAAAEQPADGHAEQTLELSAEAQRNLGLQMTTVKLSQFVQKLRIPGVVREKPAYGDLGVSSSVNGIVTRIFATPGQAVNAGDRLFELQLTGEALASAQTELLQALEKLDVLEQELGRIGPLAEQGAVAAKNKLQLEYEHKQTLALKRNRSQELLVRGLTPGQIDEIITNKRLLRTMTLTVPDDFGAAEPDSASTPANATHSQTPSAASGEFTVEELNVFPGQAVQAGDVLCQLEQHSELLVEGQAYEADVAVLSEVIEAGNGVDVEFGLPGRETWKRNLSILYQDNRVDPDSQTFRFYVTLKNEVLQDSLDEHQRRYRTWRFKPGQRVHVSIPVKVWEHQIVLPNEAVALEGPDAFVFRELAEGHDHDHAHAHAEADGDGHDHDGHDEADKGEEAHEGHLELEMVPVQVLYQDVRQTVIAADGELRRGDRVAVNQAYLLNLAVKSGSGGGGEHQGHAH